MKFAVAGSLGWAGSRHVEALRILGHEIVAVIDPGDGVEAQAADVGAVALRDISQLDLSSIEAATLALPPSMHPDAVRLLADAGKHVMCEKPMAPDVPSARALADYVSTVDVTIMPGYLLRTNPHILGFVEALRKLGPLRRIHISTNVHKPSMAGWRSEPVIGGALLVNAIHQLDLALWFADEPLTPRMSQLDNVHHEAPTEDTFFTSMVSPNGIIATVLSSWSPHPPIVSDGLMITHAGKLRIEVETDNGSIVLTSDGYRLNGQDVALDGVVGVNQFEKELDHFVGAIEGRHALCVNAEDNYNLQKLIDECRAKAIPPAGRVALRRD